MSNLESLGKRFSIPLVGIVVLLIFSPAFLHSYLWSDDFPAFIDPESVLSHAISDARPIYGLLLYGGFLSIDNVDDVAFLRLISAMGIVFLIFSIYSELRMFLNKFTLLACLMFAFCTYPWLNSVYWATTYVFSWSAGISLLGLRLTAHLLKRKKFLGIVLIATSSLIYPVSTLFPIAVRYLRGILDKKEPLELLYYCFRTFLVLFSVIFVSLLSARFITEKILGLQLNARVQIVTFQELPEKLLFFSTRLIGQSVRFFSISSPSVIEFVCSFGIIWILITIFLRASYENIRFSLMKHTISLLVVFFMLLSPFVIATDNQIDIRYFIGTNWLSAMMMALLFEKFVSNFRLNVTLSITLVSSVLVSLATWNSISFFQSVVRPVTSSTQQFIQSQLSGIKLESCENRIKIIPRSGDWPTKNMIGMASQVTDLASSWVPIPAVKVYVEKQYSQVATVEFTKKELENGDKCLVDLNSFR